MAAIRGNHPLLVTPMTADGALDEASLRRLVDYLIDNGAHGLLALGSTGEFFSMTHDERKLVIRTVVEQAAGRVPVGVGTADTGGALAGAMSRYAQDVGADYVLAPPPYYSPNSINSEEGTFRFFRDMAAATTLPVMLYDGGSGMEIPLSTMTRLARETENVRYVKLNMFAPRKVVPLQELGYTVFAGTDLATLMMLRYGVDGFTTGVASVVPRACSEAFEAARTQDFAELRRLHYGTILPVANAALIGLPQFIPSFKHLLVKMGIIANGRVRTPLVEIDGIRAAELEAAARHVGMPIPN